MHTQPDISMCRPLAVLVVAVVAAGCWGLYASYLLHPTPIPAMGARHVSWRCMPCCVCVFVVHVWEGGCNIYCYFLGFRLGRTSFSSTKICQVEGGKKAQTADRHTDTHKKHCTVRFRAFFAIAIAPPAPPPLSQPHPLDI